MGRLEEMQMKSGSCESLMNSRKSGKRPKRFQQTLIVVKANNFRVSFRFSARNFPFHASFLFSI